MQKKLLSVLLLLLITSVKGQEENKYTQYMYNQMNINPAYAGSQNKTILFSQYRTQWVGLEGAPQTMNFSINSPISERGNGLGFTLENEKIGPTLKTSVNLSFSYAIEFNNDIMLFFGVTAGGNSFQIDYTKLNIKDNEIEMTGNLSKLSPNIGAGVYLQSDKWYVGASVPKILETKFFNDYKNTIASENKTFYIHGGYIFDINHNLLFKPSFLFNFANDRPIDMNVSANFLFNDSFTVGTSYKLNSSLSALVSFNVSKKINIGYAYDHTLTNIGNYTNGSHEIFLKFNLEPIIRTAIGRDCWCY